MTQDVVLIHGAFCGGWCFSDMMPVFAARGFNCAAPDLPYHVPGPALPPDPRLAKLGIADYTRDMAAFVKRYAAPPIIVGHSMGGIIAQQIALAAPDRVRSLSLLCTFARGAQGARLSWDLFVAGMRARIGPRASRRRAFVELVMPQPYLATVDRARLDADLAELFGRDLADQPPIVMPQLRAMSRYDALAKLSALGAISTVVGSGALDRIALPAFGRELAAAIPDARYVEFEDAGHAVTIHRPDAVNSLLLRHFDNTRLER